jgi:hypothetical protein
MNSEELEFPDKRKTDAALKDNINRFTNCSRGFVIFPHDICKYNKETTREEHYDLLDHAL